VQDLNDQQRQAVQADDGPLLIIAGPGTGKTKTLAARVTYLIETARATPAEILALTFTTKAAQEMRQRVSHSGPAICTFHALCNSLLGGEQTFVTETDRLAPAMSPCFFRAIKTWPKTARK
jgi:DNA helicase-2/ATP-dependent DNA helicase PcrA